MRNDRWKYVPFSEAVADQTACGNKLQQKLFQPHGKVPIIDQGAKAVAGYSDHTTLAWKQSLPVVIFGDHTRAIKYVDYPFILGADGTKVLVARNGLTARFLYYYLHKVNLPSQGYARHFSHLKRIEVPVPSIAEQEHIVSLLDEADELRKLRTRANRRVADLIPALFHEMFGDPATNPHALPLTRLGDLCEVPPSYGTMIPARASGGEWLTLRVANIQGGLLDLNEQKFVDLPADMLGRHTVRDGDLVLARAIGSQDHLGKCVIVNPGNDKWAIDSHLMRVRLSRHHCEPAWLKALLDTPGGRQLFLNHTRRSAVQFNINSKEFVGITVPIPPLSLQKTFAQRVTEIRDMEAEQAKSRSRLDDLFQSLLHRAFDGQV